jgi:hypothetical protein
MKGKWRSRPQVLVFTASGAALLIGLGASATAQVPPSGAEQQLALLRQQFSVLEKRVAELEKTKVAVARIDGPAQPAKDSGGTKALEQRLAALEQAQVSGPGRSSVFTAPFVVVDRGGKVVMRVQDFSDKTSRGIYIYGPGSDVAVAHLGVTPDGGGRAYVTNKTAQRPQIQLIASGSDAAATVAVFRTDGGTYNSLEQQGLLIRNGDAKVIGSITSQSGTGYLALSDSNGNTMMDAGTLKSQKGYVRVNPYRASTTPQGDPSVLMGGKK